MNKNKNQKSKRLKKYDDGTSGALVAGQQNTTTDALMKQMIKMQQAQSLGSNINGALSFASNIYGDFSNPQFTTQQTYTQTSGPISYRQYNSVDSQQEMSNLNKENTSNDINSTIQGASLGMSVGGPVGAAVGGVTGLVGGLFGGASRRRKMNKMIANRNQQIQNTNNFNEGEADTQYLQTQYNKKYGSTQDSNLFNDGKNPNVKVGSNMANALVGKGETIVDGDNGNLHEVTNGSGVGIDDVRANILPQDAVAGNKVNPATGKTFAEEMKPLSRMEKKLERNSDRNNSIIAQNTADMVKRYTQPMAQAILAQQQQQLNKNTTNKYDNGKVSDYVSAGLSSLANLAPSIYNMFKGSESAQTVSPDNFYTGNPYQSQALQALLYNKYNINPELDAIQRQQSIGRYNTRAVGNESGINRAMDVENNIEGQRFIADLLAKKQQVDQQNLSNWANTAMQAGANQSAQYNEAMQKAYDINARNAAAKNAYTVAGLQGMSDYNQNQQKTNNENKMNMFQLGLMQQMYNLYHADSIQKQSAATSSLNNVVKPNRSIITPSQPLVFTPNMLLQPAQQQPIGSSYLSSYGTVWNDQNNPYSFNKWSK